MYLSRKEFIEKANQKYNLGLHNVVGVNNVRHNFSLESDLNEQLDSFFYDFLGIKTKTLSYNSICIMDNLSNSSISFNYNSLYDVLIDNNILDSHNVIIYRLENVDDNNKGVFVSNIGEKLKEFYNPSIQPSPLEEPLLKSIFYDLENRDFGKGWYFSFSNIDDMHKWLGKYDDQDNYDLFLSILNECNIEIVEYEINDCYTLETDNQVCFFMNKATKLKSYNFKKLNKKKNSYK